MTDSDRSLGQPNSGSQLLGSANQALAELVEQLTARLQAGDRVDLDAVAAEYPEFAEQLRSFLPALELLRDLSGSVASGQARSPIPTDSIPHGEPPPTLGDFRIIREIGRGGMGVVYEAEQVSMQRRVALKVLPFAAVLDPRQLQRFKNEALAAGQLQHTNIVPVYFVGCERGVHFYAMQFIEGQTLAEVIQEMKQASREASAPGSGPMSQSIRGLTPSGSPENSAVSTPQRLNTSTSPLNALSTARVTNPREFFRTVAQLGIQAAEALDHAHQVGIIHRDIKPSNLLLDARGNLWITDFGLARVGTDANLTMTGDLIGTLRYMSPEQALGNRAVVDHRTDIYSLGVTLYELLTLKPAFRGDDRGELLRRIVNEEPLPVRRISDAIPRDVETILLKAIAKEPEFRYPAAQDLADDLRRFLEDKPVLAKRPSLLERTSKWSRRHRTFVTSLVALLAIIALGLAVAVVLVRREQRHTAAALADAIEQRAVARTAVDRMYSEVAEKWLEHQPHMTAIQERFLRDALRFYEEFVKEPNSDVTARYDRAEAYRRIGDIERKLGHHDKAGQVWDVALGLWRELVSEQSDEPQYRQGLARTLNRLGSMYFSQDRLDDAEQALFESAGLREQLVRDFPDVPEYQHEFGRVQNSLAAVWFDRGQMQQAEPLCRQSLERLTALVRDFPDEPEYQRSLHSTWSNLGLICWMTGRLQDAESALRQAIELEERAARQLHVPSKADDPLLKLAIFMKETGRGAEAEEPLRRAGEIRRQMAEDFPDVPDYRSTLAEFHMELCQVLHDKGDLDGAEQSLRDALAILAQLVADFPDASEHRELLALTYANLSTLLTRPDRLADAEEASRIAMAHLESLVGAFPTIPRYRHNLAKSRLGMAQILRDEGRLTDAEWMWRDGVRRLEGLVADFPSHEEYVQELKRAQKTDQ